MTAKRRPTMLILLVLSGLLLFACNKAQPTATPLPPPRSPAEPASEARASRCGDGVCDDAERADPNLCPQDCQPTATPEPPTAVPVPPTPPSPKPEGKCGDGVCDEQEKANPQLCPQDCQPAATASVESPTPVEKEPTPEPPAPSTPPAGRCGDGICDEKEKADPELCPQDCGEGTPSVPEATQVPASGSPEYEPPINVFMVLHIDPDMPINEYTFRSTPSIYQRTREGIDWLMQEAARHGMKLTFLYNGWYPLDAMEAADLSQFQALVDAGHEIGTHAHRLTYDPAQDLWTAHIEELSFYGRPNHDPVLGRQCWDDAFDNVEAVLQAIDATGQNKVMCTRTFTFLDEGDLMEEYGFTIAAGDRAELSQRDFGHMVWNPWRPTANDEPGHELEEDLRASFISIDHLAQIGSHEVSHAMDLSVPQLQRRFLMLYAEWVARVRTGAQDKVWVFGFVYHPNYGDRYTDAVVDFLDWLDQNFIGETTPEGYTIARYASVGEIGQEFEEWEADHPGTSSFNYVRDDPYPYSYPSVASMLENAAYEAEVDMGAGVSCYRLSAEGCPTYMLWSDRGEQTVNLKELSGQVRVTDAYGQESFADAAALPLTEAPLFVEPL
jgi:hypothetical protein